MKTACTSLETNHVYSYTSIFHWFVGSEHYKKAAMSATNSAGDAFEAYTKGEFGTCGEYLEQIHNLKTAADVKVTHNILINDYFKAGCADPHNLLTLLTQAYERAREKEKKDKGKRKKEEDEEDQGLAQNLPRVITLVRTSRFHVFFLCNVMRYCDIVTESGGQGAPRATAHPGWHP